MENKKEIEIDLTSAEISALWTDYQNNTTAICGLKHFLTQVVDEDIQGLLEETIRVTEQNVEKLIGLFKKDNYPIPQGFTEQDVNLDAPRLFSDKLYLEYILNMTILNLEIYSMAISVVERRDVNDYFSNNLKVVKELHLRAKQLSQEKGTYIRSPHIPKPTQTEFVQKQSFLAGWFADRRPLLGTEITNLIFNAKRNAIGQAVITGFSQVAKSKEVRRFFERGREISGKHYEIFSSILNEENLADGARLMAADVTNSTTSPFSDKLMMALVTTLISSGIAQYGASMAVSPRRDLGVHYSRLIAEIANYSNDGAKIMIENAWMEQPPMAADRKDLAK